MNQPFQIAPGPLYQREQPVRDLKYLAYLRTFPCVGCGTARRSREAAHIGPHGIGQKASDLDALPLCRECHRTGPEALHKIGPARFQERRHLDFPALARMFQRFYCLKFGTSDWWPNTPNLTLQACPKCQHEEFAEEIQISGCPQCGWREEKAA